MVAGPTFPGQISRWSGMLDRASSAAAASTNEHRWLVVAITAVLAVGSAVRTPRLKNDPLVYLGALHRMRGGQGYYRALDAAMREGRIGPVETVRAFRLPTAFLLWRWLPTDHLVWVGFLVLVVAATAAMAWTVREPLCALLFAGYLIVVGTDGYSAPELWAAPLIAIGFALAMRGRTLTAVAVLLVASSMRELAILALIGVVLDGWGRPAVRRAALGGCSLLAVGALLHARGVRPYLVPQGQGLEAHLLGSARLPQSLLRMSGAWLPAAMVLGPILVVLAVRWVRTHCRGRMVLPHLALLLTGLAVHRPEWGLLIVPFTLCWGVDELAALVSAHRVPSPALVALDV